MCMRLYVQVLFLIFVKCIFVSCQTAQVPPVTHAASAGGDGPPKLGEAAASSSSSSSSSSSAGAGGVGGVGCKQVCKRISQKQSPTVVALKAELPSGLEVIILILADNETWVRAKVWQTVSNPIWVAHIREFAGLRSSSDIIKLYKGYNRGSIYNGAGQGDMFCLLM